MTWCDMKGDEMTWCDMKGDDMAWRNMKEDDMAWHDMKEDDMTWQGITSLSSWASAFIRHPEKEKKFDTFSNAKKNIASWKTAKTIMRNGIKEIFCFHYFLFFSLLIQKVKKKKNVVYTSKGGQFLRGDPHHLPPMTTHLPPMTSHPLNISLVPHDLISIIEKRKTNKELR